MPICPQHAACGVRPLQEAMPRAHFRSADSRLVRGKMCPRARQQPDSPQGSSRRQEGSEKQRSGLCWAHGFLASERGGVGEIHSQGAQAGQEELAGEDRWEQL